jgi:branched-chain amino acid aminotransferase
MNEPLAFLNGRPIPLSEAHLALNDAGFVLGATVTDLCRTFRHRLFRWDDHLARFRHSCQSSYIGLPLNNTEITRAAEDLVAHNAALVGESQDIALVLFATPGPIGYYLGQSSAAGEQPTFGIHTFPLPYARYRPWIEQGVALRTPSLRALPPECVDPRIKQRSRMHWWLAEQEVRRADPRAMALLLDGDGCVTETAAANFLIVREGIIVSPPRKCILNGVSLAVVGEICERLGVPLEFRPIPLDECYTADEALLTCTTFCIAGVRQINDRALPWPGPILRRLVDAWSAEVGMPIHGFSRGGP